MNINWNELISITAGGAILGNELFGTVGAIIGIVAGAALILSNK